MGLCFRSAALPDRPMRPVRDVFDVAVTAPSDGGATAAADAPGPGFFDFLRVVDVMT